MKIARYLLCTISIFIFLIGCSNNSGNDSRSKGVISLESSVFGENENIPSRFTCDGRDISPPLLWSNLPNGTKSIAIITDDPDAPVGTWVHWIIYNMPTTSNKLDENVTRDLQLENGALQGRNDFGKIGYNGPCPPQGTHRYYYKIYALDSMLNLVPGVNKEKLENAMKGHILAKGQLVGKYGR